MRFGAVPVSRALGAVLAHSVRLPDRKLRKGEALTGAHLAALEEAGVAEVVAAVLEPGDVPENEAAEALARALVPDTETAGLRLQAAFTGRVNILADGPGVLCFDPGRLHALNKVDPMITLASAPPYAQVGAGAMVGTVKIISYAVPDAALAEACAAGRGALHLARPVLRSAGLIVTEIPGGAGEKGVAAIEARLKALGMALAQVQVVPHETSRIAAALEASDGEMVLLLTGSATSDPHDVGPEALRAVGGEITRFGMPVDPGNLLFLGDLAGRPVIGLPGCVRSPALNGADWVLSRIACRIAVRGEDIAEMGVGGLLKEIPTRPQPRRG